MVVISNYNRSSDPFWRNIYWEQTIGRLYGLNEWEGVDQIKVSSGNKIGLNLSFFCKAIVPFFTDNDMVDNTYIQNFGSFNYFLCDEFVFPAGAKAS